MHSSSGSGPAGLLFYKSQRSTKMFAQPWATINAKKACERFFMQVPWVQGQWLMLIGAKSATLGAKQKGLLHPRVTDWFQRALPRSQQCR